MRHGISRTCASALVCALLALALPALSSAQRAGPRTFATAEEAVTALIDAARSGNLDDLLAIFGPDAQALIASSDPATARRNREVFTVAVAEGWRLVDEAKRKTLVIGNEDWPFPVPLIKQGNRWRFDTAAGKDEVLARRIGRNELATIETCLAYVTAQRRYAQKGHDGKPGGVYAAKFRSDPGREDGLYWPTARGQQPSPLGELVGQAAEEGRPLASGSAPPAPMHGYYFKILTYVVNGELSGGFALVAWPAQYDVTGVMTFIVNHDGVVLQKDLGPDTGTAARSMTLYNPDASWTPSE